MLWVNAELTEHHAWCFWLNWPLQCFAWPAPAVSSTAFPWSDAHFSDYLWAAPAGSSSSALSLDISSARTLLFSGRLSPWWVHWLPQLYHFYPDDSQICTLAILSILILLTWMRTAGFLIGVLPPFLPALIYSRTSQNDFSQNAN